MGINRVLCFKEFKCICSWNILWIYRQLYSKLPRKKDVLKAIDPNYKLRIVIDYDGNEISIEDNAGGIDEKNFKRALKPANKPSNTKGLNEFGLGMKYAAVWISNEWELISSAIGENEERRVLFDYEKVIKNNLKTLPFNKKTS